MEIWELVIREFYFGVSGIYKKLMKIGEDDRSQKPLSMRELFPPSMLQNGGRQIRFCHVVSRPASLLAENFDEQLFLFV